MSLILEPDLGPTRYHRRITGTHPVPGHSNRRTATLECGHVVLIFGARELPKEVLCVECRAASIAAN